MNLSAKELNNMKAIKKLLIESIAKKGGSHVADTTVWNAHNADMTNKRSNVAKLIATLSQAEKGMHYVAVVGALGRSQHSPSDVHIFKVPVSRIGTSETLYRSFQNF